MVGFRQFAAKRIAPVKSPEVWDLSHLTHTEIAKTQDFTHLQSIGVPEVFSFPGLVMTEARPQVLSIDPLEVPTQDSVDPIAEVDVLSDDMLFADAEIVDDALDDGLFFDKTRIPHNFLDSGTNIPNAKILDDVLDDGLAIPSAETVDVLDNGLLFDELHIIELSSFLSSPEIISLFEPLLHTQAVGKEYGVGDATADDERSAAQPTLTDSVTKCPHDMIRSQCEICLENQRSANRRRNEPKPRVVDVFEQLRYILQPPILPPDGQPIIFPNGERPYQFQIAGVNWLAKRKSALLADQMGLGKTVQAIIAMRVLFRRGELQRTLVVCPASMTITWEREIKSWAPELRPLRVRGDVSQRKVMWESHAEIHIVSYEMLRNDIERIQPDKFDLYVLDEAQKIKNRATRVHRAVKRLSPTCRWALTGTPIENTVDDVVALFNVIKPGLFYDGDVDWYTTSEVRRKIQPYLLRRTIEDTKDDPDVKFPELKQEYHWLELLPAQRDAYDDVEQTRIAGIKKMGDRATRIHILALITELKQICNFDVQSGQSCKLDILKDKLESLAANNEKALVFSQYPNKTLKEIEPKLQRFDPIMFDGSLRSTQRDEVVVNFQESNANKVLLMSVRAGGVGLTLTRANHVFHFDHWWNPAVMDQASARIRRIGQKKESVFVHSLYAIDTIEERIVKLLQEKHAVFQSVFGDKADDRKAEADDEDLKKLTDEDLFGLFGLPVPGEKVFLDMSPTEFEEAIQEFFEHMGYSLSLTKRSHDGGIDLDGYRIGFGGGRVVVQCKRYKETVPVSAVRDLFGVVASDNNIENGFLVTTGKFSQSAREFARGKRIRLIDGVELEARFASIASNGYSQ